MRISAVILNWNRPDDTVQAVNSVLTQTYGDFEVLVWDNASSDHSREMLTRAFGSDSRVRLLWGDSNYGVAGGRNRAFRQAQGDILLSLDSDAVMVTPHDFQRMADVMTAEPDIGAISFEVCRPDGHLMWPFARPASFWRTRRFDTIRVDGCSFATRRDVFTHLGGFAEHFSPYGAEDQLYAFQVIGQGFRVVYFPDISVVHAFNPTGRHGRQFAMHVRNMLWIPLELFPAPAHLMRAAAMALHLGRDGRERKQLNYFMQGLREAIIGYPVSRRKPMSRAAWKKIKSLIREDKEA
jgi:GT2 family glycosyltransferase